MEKFFLSKIYLLQKSKNHLNTSQPNFLIAVFWCSLSGFASFIVWAGSIPAQIYLLKLGVNKKNFAGIMRSYFFLINFSKIPFYLDLKIYTNNSLFLSFLLIPVLHIGIFFYLSG